MKPVTSLGSRPRRGTRKTPETRWEPRGGQGPLPSGPAAMSRPSARRRRGAAALWGEGNGPRRSRAAAPSRGKTGQRLGRSLPSGCRNARGGGGGKSRVITCSSARSASHSARSASKRPHSCCRKCRMPGTLYWARDADTGAAAPEAETPPPPPPPPPAAAAAAAAAAASPDSSPGPPAGGGRSRALLLLLLLKKTPGPACSSMAGPGLPRYPPPPPPPPPRAAARTQPRPGSSNNLGASRPPSPPDSRPRRPLRRPGRDNSRERFASAPLAAFWEM